MPVQWNKGMDKHGTDCRAWNLCCEGGLTCITTTSGLEDATAVVVAAVMKQVLSWFYFD